MAYTRPTYKSPSTLSYTAPTVASKPATSSKITSPISTPIPTSTKTPISSKYTPIASTSLANFPINMGAKATAPSSGMQTTTPMILPQSQTQPPKPPATTTSGYTPPSGYISPSSLSYTPPSGGLLGGLNTNTSTSNTTYTQTATPKPTTSLPARVWAKDAQGNLIGWMDSSKLTAGMSYDASPNPGMASSPEQWTTFGSSGQNQTANTLGAGIAGAQTPPPFNPATLPNSVTPNLAGGGLTPAQIAAGTNFTNNANAGIGGSTSNPVGTTGNVTPPPAPTPPANQQWQGYLSSLANLATNESPQVTAARKNLQDLQNQQAGSLAGTASQGIDIGAGTGQENIIKSLYATKIDAAQQALSNALASQAQQGGFLGTLAGQVAPQANVPYFGSPVTGNLVGGGSLFQAGALTGQQQLGQQQPALQASVNQGQTALSTIQNLIQNNPSLNLSQFAGLNALSQFLGTQAGLQNPQYQVLKNNIDSFLANASNVLGAATVNQQAMGGNIVDTINNLQQQMQNKLITNLNAGTGQNLPTNVTPTFTSVTTGGATGNLYSW